MKYYKEEVKLNRVTWEILVVYYYTININSKLTYSLHASSSFIQIIIDTRTGR